jgi:hypothetical protein
MMRFHTESVIIIADKVGIALRVLIRTDCSLETHLEWTPNVAKVAAARMGTHPR